MARKPIDVDLDEVKKALSEAKAERPQKARTMRDVIADLTDDINDLLSVGWSYGEIRDKLAEQGIEIALGTLEQYHRAARSETDSKPRATRKPKVAGTEAGTPPKKTSEPVSEPKASPAPKSDDTPKPTSSSASRIASLNDDL